MAIDPVTRDAARTPLFIAGAGMLIAGLVPFAISLLRSSHDSASGSLFWIFVPIGGLLIALARMRASREWRRGR